MQCLTRRSDQALHWWRVSSGNYGPSRSTLFTSVGWQQCLMLPAHNVVVIALTKPRLHMLLQANILAVGGTQRRVLSGACPLSS